MTKAKKDQPEAVAVKLLCILSGDGESWSAGSVIEVDAEQAAQLIQIGAAEAADPKVAE
jgi:hypothetical protein